MSDVILETDRLLLRRWRESDLAPFAALNADPQVMRHFPATLTGAESDDMVAEISRRMDEWGWCFFAVEERASGEFTGFVGLNAPDYDLPCNPCVEVGWRLAQTYWGRGYASEGAQACLDFAFGKLGLQEVVSFTTVDNQRSRAVMERLGMKNTGNNFLHPLLPPDHPQAEHVLYRIQAQ